MQNLLRLALIVFAIPASKDTRCRFKEAVAFVGDVVIVLVDSAAVRALVFEVLILSQSEPAWFPAKECFATEFHRARRPLLLQWLKARYAKVLLTIFLLYRINRNFVAFSA